MVELSALEYLQGGLSLAFVVISFILGLTIILKYFKYKNRQFILVGLTWMFLVSPYWPDAISFVMILTLDIQLPDAIYLFLATFFVAPIHIAWITVITDFLYKEKQKILVGIMVLQFVIYETILLVLFVMDYNNLGVKLAPFIAEFNIIIIVYLMTSIVLFLITGLLFVRESLRSENPELELKAKFLLLAYIIFTIGTMIDVLFADSPTQLTITLARICVIIAAFAFYVGFTLPKFVKTLFIKDE